MSRLLGLLLDELVARLRAGGIDERLAQEWPKVEIDEWRALSVFFGKVFRPIKSELLVHVGIMSIFWKFNFQSCQQGNVSKQERV